VVVLFATAGTASAQLRSDELLLVVNAAVPEGRELAEHYAQVRGVPEGRILAIDLPRGEEISAADFHERVLPAVRGHLEEKRLRGVVRCIVSFHGVPLKIAAQQLNDAQRLELSEIDDARNRTTMRLREVVEQIELVARRIDPTFAPAGGNDTPVDLLRRAEQARTSALAGQRRDQLDPATIGHINQLSGMVQQPLLPGTTRPAPSRDELQALANNPQDPASRKRLREVAAHVLPLAQYVVLLEQQRSLLNATETDASFDSELSLLFAGEYPLSRWVPNPLYVGNKPNPRQPTIVMTARLDAATPQQVRAMIDTSLRVERQGLRGVIAIDSRGIAERKPDGSLDGYGWYDQSLRNLATLLQPTAATVVHDTQEAIFTPGQVKDIAVYVGWYSVGNYVPPGTFVEGAVAYHVASFEMTSLRDPNNKGWSRGLIGDGVVATLGPVSEPYLHAFPRADEFVPLLLTGQLSLAEVYWRTNMLTSWKVALVGDPLYRPFATNPLLTPAQLSEPLRSVLPE
jgi:uncharacterized protein (TIGR03790 family)